MPAKQSRRRFLIGGAAGLAGGLLGLVSEAEGALRCGPRLPPWGAQRCEAGIPTWQANMTYAPQPMSQWCWAACIHMVFAHHGYDVPMATIVRQAWGAVVNMPGSPYQILASLNRRWRDTRGRLFEVRGDTFSASAPAAARDLSAERPLIIGSLGHAMVLTSITYDRLPNGAGRPVAMVVRDPWPGRGRRLLSPQEVARTSLLVRIAVRGR